VKADSVPLSTLVAAAVSVKAQSVLELPVMNSLTSLPSSPPVRPRQRGRALILDIWSSERLRRSERCGGESFVSKHSSILDEYTILTNQMV
jgi:hypothetical protein